MHAENQRERRFKIEVFQERIERLEEFDREAIYHAAQKRRKYGWREPIEDALLHSARQAAQYPSILQRYRDEYDEYLSLRKEVLSKEPEQQTFVERYANENPSGHRFL